MLVSAVQGSEPATSTHISPPSWAFFPPHPSGPHRAPSWAPSAIQQLLTRCFPRGTAGQCCCQLPPPSASPHCVHKSVLHARISIPALQIGSSEREKEILYINAYIWNLEKCYWWTPEPFFWKGFSCPLWGEAGIQTHVCLMPKSLFFLMSLYVFTGCFF